ncbi:MAG: EamA family transporter [Acidilobus sp.]
MRLKWRRWLAAYTMSQVGLYFTTKVVLSSMGPFLYLPIYLLGSSAILEAVSGRGVRPSRDVVILGILQGASAALWLLGLFLLPPASAAAINYFMPFVAMGLAAIAFGRGLDAWEGAGAAVGAAGVAIYAASSLHGVRSELGVAVTLANTVAWASYSLYYARLSEEDPVALNAASLLVAGLATLPALAFGISGPRPSLRPVILLAWLLASIASSALGYVSWTRLMGSLSVPRATLSSYAAPAAIAVIQGALGEPVSAPQGVGLGVMVLGAAVSFMSRAGKR